MSELMTYMPFCIIAMAHSLWTLCEHGNIWQPLNASCKSQKTRSNVICCNKVKQELK